MVRSVFVEWEEDVRDAMPAEVKMSIARRVKRCLDEVYVEIKDFVEKKPFDEFYGELMIAIWPDVNDEPCEALEGGEVWLSIPMSENFNPYVVWIKENRFSDHEGEEWIRKLAEVDVKE